MTGPQCGCKNKVNLITVWKVAGSSALESKWTDIKWHNVRWKIHVKVVRHSKTTSKINLLKCIKQFISQRTLMLHLFFRTFSLHLLLYLECIADVWWAIFLQPGLNTDVCNFSVNLNWTLNRQSNSNSFIDIEIRPMEHSVNFSSLWEFVLTPSCPSLQLWCLCTVSSHLALWRQTAAFMSNDRKIVWRKCAERTLQWG